MIRHISRRLLLAIPTLLAVFTIIFIIVRVAPGDPAVAALGDYASADAVAALRERMGLSEQIAFVLPYTLELTATSILIGLVLGIPTGVLTAIRRNTAVDYVGRTLSLLGLSFPSFYLGILLMFFFAVRLGLFPSVGSAPFSEPVRNLHYLVLPALTLGLIETAYIARMTRSAVLTILTDDYIRTARAKGMEESVVLVKHALRAALIPIVSLVGIFAISLIGSSVLVEEVFARPGLGKLMVGATKQKDYTTLQSIMVVYALIIVIINLVVDIIYTYVDPRVRFS